MQEDNLATNNEIRGGITARVDCRCVVPVDHPIPKGGQTVQCQCRPTDGRGLPEKPGRIAAIKVNRPADKRLGKICQHLGGDWPSR